jgi:hypothetical protein
VYLGISWLEHLNKVFIHTGHVIDLENSIELMSGPWPRRRSKWLFHLLFSFKLCLNSSSFFHTTPFWIEKFIDLRSLAFYFYLAIELLGVFSWQYSETLELLKKIKVVAWGSYISPVSLIPGINPESTMSEISQFFRQPLIQILEYYILIYWPS